MPVGSISGEGKTSNGILGLFLYLTCCTGLLKKDAAILDSLGCFCLASGVTQGRGSRYRGRERTNNTKFRLTERAAYTVTKRSFFFLLHFQAAAWV